MSGSRGGVSWQSGPASAGYGRFDFPVSAASAAERCDFLQRALLRTPSYWKMKQKLRGEVSKSKQSRRALEDNIAVILEDTGIRTALRNAVYSLHHEAWQKPL